MKNRTVDRGNGSAAIIMFGVMGFIFAMTAYFVLRFGGLWSVGDTSRLTQATANVTQTGRLIPPDGREVYSNGFAYSALSLFLSELGAISNQTLQVQVLPFMSLILACVAFATYRIFLGKPASAMIATLFVFLQPDFLFVVFRGSHEKLTWLLVFMAFLLLAKSFTVRDRIRHLISWVMLFYLVSFSLFATNVFFASSFVLVIAVSLVAGVVLLWISRLKLAARDSSLEKGRPIRRLLYITVSSLILLYLFMFAIYPPAQFMLTSLGGISNQLFVLGLDLEPASDAASLYSYVPATWVDQRVYLLLTVFTYVVLLAAVVVWIREMLSLLKARTLKSTRLPRLLLLLIFPAFLVQFAASFLVSLTGIAGQNIQLRILTPTMLVAVPLTVLGLGQLASSARTRWSRKLVVGLASIGVFAFSVFALLKSTNEPVLNNKWLFHTRPEASAGGWLLEYTASAKIWTGMDGRLARTLEFLYADSLPPDIGFDAWDPDMTDRYYMLSDTERLRFYRMGVPLPYTDREQRVYDAGTVEVYYRRPRTSFQK